MNLGIIGAGHKAQECAASWIAMPSVVVTAIADPSQAALASISRIIADGGGAAPRLFANWQDMLRACADRLDAIYICTPHKYHVTQAVAALKAGLHVLLEKPMAMTVAEAKQLEQASHEFPSKVVIAFQGALSPLTRKLKRNIQAGRYGDLISISGMIWEDWADKYRRSWKQNPEIGGGGFMFDTGAHMLNTISLLSNAEFVRLSALMSSWGRPVDIAATVAGELTNGALVSMHASGWTIPQCRSRIDFFFTKAIARIDAWGAWLEVETATQPARREAIESWENPLQLFMDVIDGKARNPSTVQQGVRFAQLWDAIKESAHQNGNQVSLVAD